MNNRYLVIDSHVHIGISLWQNFLAEDLLKVMDENNQDMAVVFGPNINFENKWRFNYYSSNDYIADVQKKYPDRLIGLGIINPWYQINKNINNSEEKEIKVMKDSSINEIERCVFELNLKGFKFHPNQHGYSFNDPVLMPPIFDKILEVQNKIGRKLYNVVHLWVADTFCSVEKLALNAEDYPELCFVAAHGGDGFGGEAMIEIAKKHENIFIDFNYNTNPIRKLKEALEEIGASRIFMGSDCCYNTFGVKMDIVNQAVTSKADKRMILGGNLQEFFGIK